MNILERIALTKKQEVQQQKVSMPLSTLQLLPHYKRNCVSLKSRLNQISPGIIAEFKRGSPSQPQLNSAASVEEVTLAYQKAGAAGISVLTDTTYFQGRFEDLTLARNQVSVPLLRKDFIIDPYQIVQSKALGADVVLLIASILTRNQVKEFRDRAKDLGMEVLLEVHNETELQKTLMPDIDMVGVNNRDLTSFKVHLSTSKNLAEKIPDQYVKVSESGISGPEEISDLMTYGYKGFLIGGNFMKEEDPGRSAANFLDQLKKK